MLCRLLRDRGLNAETIDDFASSSYAKQYEGSLAKEYDLITAFEVFEHLASPAQMLSRLFQSNSKFVVASTEKYAGQSSDWWYLAPEHGQHIFFYSSRTFKFLAQRFQYFYYEISGRHVFAKAPLTRIQRWTLSRMTSGRLFKVLRALLPFSETWHWISRDLDSIRRNRAV